MSFSNFYGKFFKDERALFKQKPESEMTTQDCKDLVAKFKEVLENEKATLPYEPKEQLKLAINAVLTPSTIPEPNTIERSKASQTTQEQQ